MNEHFGLLKVLQDALSSEKLRRSQAEEQIALFTNRPGSLVELVFFLQTNALHLSRSQRLVVLSIVKQKVTDKDPDERIGVVFALLDSLKRETDVAFVKLSAAVISVGLSSMGHAMHFNPQASRCLYSVVDFCSERLKGRGVAFECTVAVFLLSELLSYNSSSSTLREKVLLLTPNLLQFVLGENVSEANILAIDMVSDVLLHAMAKKEKNAMEFIKEMWISVFPTVACRILVSSCSSSEGCVFRNKIAAGLITFVESLLLTVKWSLKSVTVDFVREALVSIQKDSLCFFEAREKVDDEALAVQHFMAKRWSLLRTLIRFKPFRNIFESILCENKEFFIDLTVQHAMLCELEAEEWVMDVSAFLKQEEEMEDMVQKTRYIAADTCQLTVPIFGPDFFHILFNILSSTSALQSWKKRESILFVLDVVLQKSSGAWTDVGAEGFNAFLRQLLETDLKSASPILATRALSVLGRFLILMKRHEMNIQSISVSLIPQAVLSMEGPVPLLRAAACKLLCVLLPIESACNILAFADCVQNALFTLVLSDDTPSELIYVGLELCTEWISKCHSEGKNVVLLSAHHALFKCWLNHIEDPNIGELIVMLFGELIIESSGDEAFLVHIPWIVNVLQGQCSLSECCATPTVIEIVKLVLEKGSDSVVDPTANSLLDTLCGLLLMTEDSSTLVSASSCLSVLLQRCPQARTVLVHVLPSKMKFGLGGDVVTQKCKCDSSSSSLLKEEVEAFPLSQVLLAIAGNMLSEEKKEATLMNFGRLLSAIARNTTEFSDDEIVRIIAMIVRRLLTVRTDTVLQELITPIAVLLKNYTEAFIRVVLSFELLVDMFSIWLPKMSVFLGTEDLFQSCDALAELLVIWPIGEQLLDQVVYWGEGEQRQTLPLNQAIFLAIGKGILNIATQLPSADGENGNESGSDWIEDDDYANNNSDDESCKAKGEVMSEEVILGEIPDTMQALLRKVQPIVSQYSHVVSAYFSTEEVSELSFLFHTSLPTL